MNFIIIFSSLFKISCFICSITFSNLFSCRPTKASYTPPPAPLFEFQPSLYINLRSFFRGPHLLHHDVSNDYLLHHLCTTSCTTSAPPPTPNLKRSSPSKSAPNIKSGKSSKSDKSPAPPLQHYHFFITIFYFYTSIYFNTLIY